ncbi:MAG: agmatine deiminase family protein [Bacteroidales bacterium]|nr:agmatine deiminase family protein [Bacteroidales bacterium]MCF8344546.1 agmatine deiminase family protein [Bacteroidales bacterium]MCF8350738.1 agmatine deiminase family protein [Bacteroidales bacterium]MCF8376325.1 agmatine deiminase family protein [Bacteroidales bacterium]MCF8401018.1 agmatine deiminase family protein [Bacteroidales bacterium]
MKILKSTFVLLVLLTIGNYVSSQEKTLYFKRMHFLSEEEMKNHDPGNIGRDFYPTDPPPAPVRNIAEFNRMQSVLVRYPFGIPMTLVAEMSENCNVTTLVENSYQENTVRDMYSSNGVNMDHIDFIYAPTDSYWTRDYGPWFVINGAGDFGVVNFPYNRPRPNDNDVPIEIADHLGIDLYGMNVIQTGGNYMTDGLGISAQTELVWEENPDQTHDEIDSMMQTYLGIDTFHVLPDPLGEYIDHIDCWGKFLDVDKVLIGQVPESDPRYDDFEYVADYFAEHISSYGNNYQVYRVQTPGTSPNTPYTNSLILNKKVFVPITGHQLDDEALEAYEVAMPGYEVIGIYHNAWENTDALHCRAKGIADLGMLYIKHMPFLGEIPFQQEYLISAIIRPYSEEPLYPDSIKMRYKVDNGVYTSLTMQQEFGYKYTAVIPAQDVGSEISYYIYAADESGRRETHPFIGSADPHVFTVGEPEQPDITVYPDSLVYLTFDQMIEGQDLIIRNYSSNTVQIDTIEPESYEGGFHWYIDPYNTQFPYQLEGGDSLVMRVYVDVITAQPGGLLIDSLDVESAVAVHHTIIAVDEDLVGVEDLSAVEQLSIYPNPFTNQFNVRFDMQAGKSAGVLLTNMQGKVLKHYNCRSSQNNIVDLKIDGTDLPAGIYLLRIKTSDAITGRKLIKLN